MKKIFYLSSCNTCKRIISELDLSSEFIFQDIKAEPISEGELSQLKTLAGSYEALFSKRAQLYKQRGLKNENLSETDFKNLILEHYTFLKRPIILYENEIFVGNSKKTIEAAKKAIS